MSDKQFGWLMFVLFGILLELCKTAPGTVACAVVGFYFLFFYKSK